MLQPDPGYVCDVVLVRSEQLHFGDRYLHPAWCSALAFLVDHPLQSRQDPRTGFIGTGPLEIKKVLWFIFKEVTKITAITRGNCCATSTHGVPC